MELPHLGEHCTQPGCHQLDYLPITCSLCNKTFCNDHHKYENHSCPESYKIDVRVPICPLCSKPVPSKRGLTPDLAVNEHLENNCQSKSKTIYSNKCSVSGCKVKELVSIKCDDCSLNYCLRHRHTSDHDCKGPVVAKRERTLGGSIFKNWMNGGSSSSSSSGSNHKGISQSNGNVKAVTTRGRRSPIVQVAPPVRGANVSIYQGNLSEEEALQKALLTSQGAENSHEIDPTVSEDENIARAIALSLEQQPTGGNGNTEKSSDCSIS